MKLNDLPTLMVWNKRFISWKWICKCKFTNLLIILNFSLVCFHYQTNIIKNSLSLSIKIIKIETLLNIFFLFFYQRLQTPCLNMQICVQRINLQLILFLLNHEPQNINEMYTFFCYILLCIFYIYINKKISTCKLILVSYCLKMTERAV